MSKITSIGTADGPFKIKQEELKAGAYNLLSTDGTVNNRIFNVFDNSLIDERHFAYPLDWHKKERDFREKSESFVKCSVTMSISAINKCLQNYGGDYTDFDHIIFVTSTGISAPTVDALLINELRLDTHMRRTPIWGLGCAGGAAGLSRAMEYTRAYPQSAVLLIALEICSLAFHKDDMSKRNIVASALFSDGAAAAIIAGKEHRLYPSARINLIDSLSTIYYGSLDVMGWEIVKSGLKPVFSKDIPSIVSKSVKTNIRELTDKNCLKLSDLRHFLVHPGGAKVLKEYEASLGYRKGEFKYSRKVLREHGNMSSPTVLYVIKEFMNEGDFESGEKGIISALGPGFSSELLLFRIT